MNESEIPIYNIYYLLCYAWNKLDEKDIVAVDASDCPNMINLFAKILIIGVTHLIKKGFDRGYINNSNELNTVKGKVDFTYSLRHNSFRNAKCWCNYDEFDYDILHNQIIKATLIKLLKFSELDQDLKLQLFRLYRYFSGVSDRQLSTQDFNNVHLNHNNYFYKFLLNICKLIIDNTGIDETKNRLTFKDFTRDEKAMSALFESFIRNFFRIELKRKFADQNISVGSEHISWDISDKRETPDLNYLPDMITDCSITINKNKYIIDAKYYQNALSTHYDKQTLISGNLYQLFSYIKNSEKTHLNKISGILVYPTTTKELDLKYEIQGNQISVKTLNLNEPDWRKIHNRLLSFLR